MKEGWSLEGLSEHFQNMSYEELISKKDSIFIFLMENEIEAGTLNHAVYALIDKKEYQKAVVLARVAFTYAPHWSDLLDSLGEAYFNNGEIEKVRHYVQSLKFIEPGDDRYGLEVWKKNRKERLAKDFN